MAQEKLSSYLSGQIARTNPFQGGPAFEAWQNGSSVMASTWGDYASRLSEHLSAQELTLDEVLARLCISHDHLNDPSIHFGEHNIYEFGDYKSDFRKKTGAEADDYYATEIERLQLTFDVITEGYKVADVAAAEDEADTLQLQINEDAIEMQNRVDTTDEEAEEYDIRQTIRCMRRDALWSGVVVPLAELADAMLAVNLIHEGEFKSELADVWLKALSGAFEDMRNEWPNSEEIKVDQIVLSGYQLARLRADLSNIAQQRQDHFSERWKEVRPVFLTDFSVSK